MKHVVLSTLMLSSWKLLVKFLEIALWSVFSSYVSKESLKLEQKNKFGANFIPIVPASPPRRGLPTENGNKEIERLHNDIQR